MMRFKRALILLFGWPFLGGRFGAVGWRWKGRGLVGTTLRYPYEVLREARPAAGMRR
jgi:hypothetical protein